MREKSPGDKEAPLSVAGCGWKAYCVSWCRSDILPGWTQQNIDSPADTFYRPLRPSVRLWIDLSGFTLHTEPVCLHHLSDLRLLLLCF